MAEEPGPDGDALVAFWGLPSQFLEYGAEETRVSTGSAGKNAIARLSFEKFD